MKRTSPTTRADRPAGLVANGAQILFAALLLATAAVMLNLPWPLEPSARAALPYLALPIVHWHAFRMPAALPAPVVLAAGLLADLMADTPLGFWALIYLCVLASGRGLGHLLGNQAGMARAALAVPVYATVAATVALLTIYLYTLVWPSPAPILAGIGLGAALELMVSAIARSILPHPPALQATAADGER